MSNLNRHPVRRTAAGILAGALAFSGAVAAATPANALPQFDLTRLAGADRYETAAVIARNTFPQGSGTVILASGEDRNFPDALAGNYLAGKLNAPILLTASGSLSPATRTALTQLNATNVIIIGGTTAVSSSVMASVDAMANMSVRRIGGDDRYDTAAAVALEANAGTANVGMVGGQRTAIVGTGQDAADILAAGPLAFAAQFPIIITRPGALPAESANVLRANGIQRVLIVGGTTAVSMAVEDQIKATGVATVTRLAGAQRTNTAVAIAEFAIANLGFSNSHVNLARQDVFADALAGGPHAGKEKAPILLTAPTTLSPATEEFLRRNAGTLVGGHIFGGFAAVSAAVEAAAETAGRTPTGPVALTALTVAQGGNLTGTITGDFSSVTFTGCGFTTPQTVGADNNTTTAGRQFTIAVPATQPVGNCDITFTFTPTGGGAAITQVVRVGVTAAVSNQDFMVTPTEAATNQFSAGTDDTSTTADETNRGRRTYTVSGLDSTRTYDIVLLPAEDVTNTAGVISFQDTDASSAGVAGAGNNLADVEATEAVIELVNNAASGDTDGSAEAIPVNGTVQFTIDSDAADQVIPVIFLDADNDGLDLDANNQPSELFAIGGQKNFVAPAAGAGPITAGEIQSVNKGADQFSTAAFTFTFDANDVFNIGAVRVTQAAFEEALSSGDSISGSVASDPSLPSTFTLADNNPGAPTAVTAQAGTGNATNDITVTVTFPAGTDVDSVVIQRAAVTGTGATDELTTGDVGTFATVTTVTPTEAQLAAGSLTFVDNDVAVGTFRYRAALVNDGDQGAFTADPANESSTAPAADTVGPTATDTRLTTDAGFANVLDAGDVFVVRLDEAMAAPAAGATLRVQDNDATPSVIDLVNGTNATFSVNAAAIPATPTTDPNAGAPAGTVLTVTITGTPTVITAGTSAGVSIPATIVNSVGINDVAGNRLNVAAGDRVIDVETTTTTPTTPPSGTTDTTAPVFTTTSVVAGSRDLVVNFDEAVTCGDVSVADFTIRLTGLATDISPTSFVCTDADTVTLTFANGTPFESGQSGTVDAVDGQVVRNLALIDQVDTDQTTFSVA